MASGSSDAFFPQHLTGVDAEEDRSLSRQTFEKMPKDIIGRVFEEVANSNQDGYSATTDWPESDPQFAEFHRRGRFPLKLAGVCRLWREVATDYASNWRVIKAILSPDQSSASNDGTVAILNQAEVDTLTAFSKQGLVRLSFGTSSRVVLTPSITPLRIDKLLGRIEAVLLDACCKELLSTFARLYLPKLNAIHVGNGKAYENIEKTAWSDLLVSRFWRSDEGVKRLLWASSDEGGLESNIDWTALTEVSFTNGRLLLSEEDIYGMLAHCKRLKKMTGSVGPFASHLPTHIHGSLRGGKVQNASIEELRLVQNTWLPDEVMGPLDPEISRPILTSLVLPHLKRLIVEHTHCSKDFHVQWMTIGGAIGSVEYLHINPRAVPNTSLALILRAMPNLRELTFAPFVTPSLIWMDFPQGYGSEDCHLRAVKDGAQYLTTFKMFGVSWLSYRTLAGFIRSQTALKFLQISLWGGASHDQLETLRLNFPELDVRCGVVAPCAGNPGFMPNMVPNPEREDPVYEGEELDYIHIVPKRMLDHCQDEVLGVFCEECRGAHGGDELDRDAYGEPPIAKFPHEFV